MIQALLSLPLHLRERLATALEAGLLTCAAPIPALQSVLGDSESLSQVALILQEFERLGVPGAAGAAWIRSLGLAESRSRRIDLVWSGPEGQGLYARDTRRVFDELIGAAEHTLWVSTYAFFDGPKAFGSLARRMDAVPGLKTTLLLNLQRRRGDTTSSDQLVRGFADRFWSIEWPGTSRPKVFFDPRALEPEGPGGVLHAKALVADDTALFVTSANLTEAALHRNIELGLLVRDPSLAASASSYFQGLIDRGLLNVLPAK